MPLRAADFKSAASAGSATSASSPHRNALRNRRPSRPDDVNPTVSRDRRADAGAGGSWVGDVTWPGSRRSCTRERWPVLPALLPRKQRTGPTGPVSLIGMWRRRWDSDPRIEVLQTSPLATWVRRPGAPAGGSGDAGWPSRIRTSVHGSKVRCPTARRRASGTRAALFGSEWSGRRDSNPRPSPWQGDALPTEPLPLDDRVRGGGAERQT